MGQFDQNHNIGTPRLIRPAQGRATMECFMSVLGTEVAHDPQEFGQSTSEPMSSIMRIDPLGVMVEKHMVFPLIILSLITRTSLRDLGLWVAASSSFFFDIDGTMYICDIGQTQIEEVNIGQAGQIMVGG